MLKNRKQIWHALRFGQVLHNFQYFLLRRDIYIMPYYWTQEGIVETPPPPLKDNPKNYLFRPMGRDDMRIVSSVIPDYTEQQLVEKLEAGIRCYGLTHQGEIAAFMWCNFKECTCEWHRVTLKDHEAYLFAMYTMDAFRGKSIAPYLRHRVYATLREMGKDTFYSITECFNSPSKRFKSKLGARFLWMGIGLNLKGKFRKHLVIKLRKAEQGIRPTHLQVAK